MLIIGLTGPSGAGKGTVAALFARRGIPSVDTDEVYHRLLTPPSACLDELTDRFGTAILSADGTLNRRALADIVFTSGNELAREDLNRITHRRILDSVLATCARLEQDGCPAVLIDAPLLYESGFDRKCDRVIAVLSDRSSRISRIMRRDGLNPDEALRRIHAQPEDDFYSSKADAVIENNGRPEDMDSEVNRLLSEWGVCCP